MDFFSLPPIAATLDAAYSALMSVASLLEPLAGSSAAASAVVLVTLVVRALLIPAGVAQARAEQTRARIAPALRRLHLRHGADRERLQRETMRLYADEKTSPLAGCVPVLIQAPVVGVLYALFLHTAIAGHPNELLVEQLFGVPLGMSLVSALGAGALTASTGIVFGILIAVIAVVAEITRRALRVPVTAEPSQPGSPGASRVIGMLHFGAAVAAMFVPLAAGLYLLVTVTWTLGQRLLLRRLYPLE